MIVRRQKEFGNRANKEATRKWRIKQGMEMAADSPGSQAYNIFDSNKNIKTIEDAMIKTHRSGNVDYRTGDTRSGIVETKKVRGAKPAEPVNMGQHLKQVKEEMFERMKRNGHDVSGMSSTYRPTPKPTTPTSVPHTPTPKPTPTPPSPTSVVPKPVGESASIATKTAVENVTKSTTKPTPKPRFLEANKKALMIGGGALAAAGLGLAAYRHHKNKNKSKK